MQSKIGKLIEGHEVSCHIIYIDEDPELEHRYGARVPVLLVENKEICQFKLDEDAIVLILQFLA